MPIVGREEEIELLERLYSSKKAEFLAIYGRRRVGKTYLVTQFFKEKGIFFEVTGLPNASVKEQLLHFHREFCALFCRENSEKPPKNWTQAFERLKNTCAQISPKKKIVIFFDELPWLSSPKSGFLSALDYFWNRHFSRMSHVFLIVCGSAASWMINQIVNNKGGLYGRLSAHLRLRPFTLTEVEQYLYAENILLPRKQICELYMVMGGIPKYHSLLKPAQSVSQCIHDLCFRPQSPLLTEFHKLYHSLFSHPEQHIEIVKVLAKRRYGLTRKNLLKEAKMTESGRSSEILRELEECDFILVMPELGKQSRDAHYFLNDEYSLFYLNWIDPAKSTLLQGVEEDYWLKRQSSQEWHIWAGLAFESLCLKHVNKIKHALRIGAVSSNSGHWKFASKGKSGTEIDLIIDRADQCINLCEIKFHNDLFMVSASYAKELQRKKELFKEHSNTKKALFTTLITPYGATKNPALLSAVDNQITVDQLF